MSLVLSTLLGCVSPQFHEVYDDFFETVQDEISTIDIIIKWQQLSEFTKVEENNARSTQGVIVPKKRKRETQMIEENTPDCVPPE